MIWNIIGIDRFKANSMSLDDNIGSDLQGCTIADGEILRDISRAELILLDKANENRAALG